MYDIINLAIFFSTFRCFEKSLHCDVSRLNKALPCHICPLEKQRRLSFDSHNHMSQFPFNLAHCDIWGPYSVSSHARHRYFITLVDDCSWFT